MQGLSEPKLRACLADLHRASRGDFWIFAKALPAVVWGAMRGRPITAALNPRLDQAYIGVPPAVGELLFLTARAIGARQTVEFGTSFGISALYLGAAMRECGGRLFGTELAPNKLAAARANIERAGLTPWVEVRGGDAMQSLQDLAGPIDLVLLDGWKDLYLPVLHMLTPKLRPGSIVFADNIHTFRKSLRPYVNFVQDPANGFESTTLPLGSGLEYSVFRGKD